MTKYIGGFDPGKKGAFVAIEKFSGKLARALHVPLIRSVQNHRAPKKPTITFQIDWPALESTWGPVIHDCEHIFIENIWGAAPAGKGRKDGGASQFKLGYAAGVPYGMILTRGVAHTFNTPQTWHKALDYPKNEEDPKAPSFDLAREFFPESLAEFERKTVDEGVAEASLIAYVGRRLLNDREAESHVKVRKT